MAVLLFHANKYFLDDIAVTESIKDAMHLTLFGHGAAGVEFFFMVSGFLMAKSACKRWKMDEKTEKLPDIGTDTVQFLAGKVKAILPYHLITFVIATVSYLVKTRLNPMRTVVFVVSSIPSLFLVQMSGISGGNPNHVEWYISAMLLSMLLLYPLLRKNYSVASRVVAPAVALFVMGWLSQECGRVSGVSVWEGLCYRSVLRGISELCFGIVAFEIVRFMDEKQLNGWIRALLTLIEVAAIAVIAVFFVFNFPNEYEITAAVVIFIIVILAFSRQTLLGVVFDNPVSYFLGKLSLPIYLCQVSCVNFTTVFSKIRPTSPVRLVELCVFSTIVMSFVVMAAGDFWASKLWKVKK